MNMLALYSSTHGYEAKTFKETVLGSPKVRAAFY